MSQLPPLETIESLTSLDEIQKWLEVAEKEKRELVLAMGDVNERAAQTLPHFQALDALAPTLHPLNAAINRAADSIDVSEKIAAELAGAVKNLDDLRERVSTAIQHVQDVMALSECAEGVQKALDERRLDDAAGFVQRYLMIDPSLVEGATRDVLEASRDKLRSVLASAVDAALKEKTRGEVKRLCGLYARVHENKAGAEKYLLVCQDDLRFTLEQSRLALEKALEKVRFSTTDKVNFANSAAKLLHSFEVQLKEVKAALDPLFGPLGIGLVAAELQPLVDRELVRQISEFRKLFSISKCVAEAQRILVESRGRMGAEGPTFSAADDVPAILQQVSSLSQAVEAHRTFMRALIKATKGASSLLSDVSKLPPHLHAQQKADAQALLSSLDKLAGATILDAEVQQLIGEYCGIDSAFVFDNARKVLFLFLCLSHIPKLLEAPSSLQGAIDDFFFLLQETSARAFMTGNVNAVCTFINTTDEVINTTLFPLLTSRGSGKRGLDDAFLVGLNALELGTKYVGSLKHNIETPARVSFKKNLADVQKILVLLDSLGDSERKLRIALHAALDALSAQIVAPLSAKLVEALPKMQYEIGEAHFNSNQVNDPWATRFLSDVQQTLQPLKATLSEANFDWALRGVLSFLAKRLEALVLSSKFSKAGARQFDKEFLAVTSFLSQYNAKGIRDHFERLRQMTDVLNVDDASDVKDLHDDWDLHGARHLSNLEVTQVLLRRADFQSKASQITKLFK